MNPETFVHVFNLAMIMACVVVMSLIFVAAMFTIFLVINAILNTRHASFGTLAATCGRKDVAEAIAEIIASNRSEFKKYVAIDKVWRESFKVSDEKGSAEPAKT